jgi:hypothetical protein
MSAFFKRAFIFAVCLFLVNSLFAIQIQTGEIIGKVTDVSGATIPGVKITAQSPSLQGTRTVYSDRNGNYRFPLLPIGEYSLTFELEGFQTRIAEDYDVRLGFTASIDVALQIAGVEETITVTGESPIVDIKNADVSIRLSTEELTQIPSAERTIQELARLVPGVTGVRADTISGTGTGSPSFRGEGAEGNNWIIDGLSSKGSMYNCPGVRINFDSWSEVQVTSDPIDPGSGHSQGAIINIFTKTGGNELHGEVGALIRDKSLRAERKDQLSVVSEPNTSIHNYLGNLGGPFIKDKFWFFFSYNFHRTADDSDVETIDWLTIPSGKRRLSTNNLFGKVTFTPHEGHSLSFSGTLDKFLSQSGGIGLTETYTKTEYTDQIYRLNYLGILGQNTLLEAAFGQSDQDSEIKQIEEDFGPARYYWSDIGQYTNNAMADRVTVQRRKDFNTRLTQYFDLGGFGNHEIGAGFSYYRTYSEDDVRWTGRDFDLWPGNGFDNGVEITWLSPGNPYRLREYGNYGVVDYTNGISLYFKDRFTIGRFAFMLGLRTETQRIFNDVGDKVWSWGLGDFLSPRAGLAVDLLGDGNNILKFSFGQFKNPITTKVLEFFNTEAGFNWSLYSWEGGFDPTEAQLQDSANWSSMYSQTQTSYAVDSGLNPNNTTKFWVEFDRQLGRNWALKLRGVYSKARNITELVGVYDPVNVFAWVFKNFEYKKRDYRAVEAELNGRIEDKLMLNASYTWSQAKGTNPGQFELGFWDGTAGNAYEAGVFGDRMKLPDGHAWKDVADWYFAGLGGEDYGDAGWYGFLPYSVDHQVKILGTYFAPYGLSISAFIEYLSGYHWEKKGWSDGYGDWYLFPEGRGGRTTPAHMYVDLSVEKDFTLPRGFTLGVRLNAFNILNSQRPVSFVKADTALFGQVWGRQEPFWLQLQAILRF